MTDASSPTLIPTNEWRKSNILIVDDEPGVLRQIERDLIVEDFRLLKAHSAEEGLQILEDQPIHVIVSDQKMGDGMCGTRFLAEARQRRPHIVGIILSAYSESKYVLEALNEARAFLYLLKPWDKVELIQALTQALKMSYASRLQGQEQQVYQINLLERLQKSEQNLQFAHQMLNVATLEASSHRSSIQETAHALSVFSDVACRLARNLEEQLKKEFSPSWS